MVDVILPVLDEVEAIPRVIASLPADYRPIVVDNGSTDCSADVARSLGAYVVTETRRGFGAACAAGLDAATSDIVCFMDCDGSFDGSELPRVVAPVEAGDAHLVLGTRIAASRGAWPWHARMANRVIASELRRRLGLTLHDLGPMRAAPTAALRLLGITDRRFGWPLEMVVRAAHAGWTVCEVPVTYSPRIGSSKVTGTVRGSARATLDMAKALR